MKILIVGGVAGGMSAATRLRRLMEDAEIIVFDKGPYVSFANCGLPYHVSGEIAERSSLLVQTPERLKARFNLDVRPESEVLSIDPENKSIEVQTKTETYTESYDKLILSPGAKPFVPPMTGLDQAENVFTLRSIPDLDQIMAQLEGKTAGVATVIGAGFIGLEMAENLAKKGLEVTLIEKAPHVLPPLDQEMAAFVEAELVKQGITVITGQSAQAFEDKGKTLVLEDGRRLSSDVTILSVGVQPENGLAQSAGLELGLRGGILVDEQYQTSQEDIYAVGDAVVVKQQITGEDALIALASPANRQGRQVADVIAGLPAQNKGSIGTAIVRVFDMVAASTGLSERVARQTFDKVAVVHTSGNDHAGYYPGATTITLKLIFNPETGAIYGAQAVGQKGVDKRIDILATAIKAGLTIEDLPELEFTYAPPFGSAKDPVNMIGYAAMNLAQGLSHNVQWYDLSDELAKGKVLLDVRNPGELTAGRFPNAIAIPLDDLRNRLGELDKSQSYIVSCHSGLRSYVAERILKQAGFEVANLDGAYALYQMVKPEDLIYD
ncbi:FAD-dependent oxidoreductase [Streptococcus moroccensis]|uniref:NADPH-dependent 2,4-dienoyl-CoA reductase/sulfur reductase-like enzyme/rhodanese-related sulfurtransferase n=1 Tax=Streptococcus moroccensis TaxID=1451356 RepID=A0ABT9YQL9_9STRE|nr:FAD-dependent oxidoreductase [Streptococcus moroccensis]MDQ0222293.1 NADPH-dependent 2,4-dienoyl-CoA reductase/sulfur reductase-like enzyme/rhodanese-related sulfurtransferase [Streptococcus moroccensis]